MEILNEKIVKGEFPSEKVFTKMYMEMKDKDIQEALGFSYHIIRKHAQALQLEKPAGRRPKNYREDFKKVNDLTEEEIACPYILKE